MLSSVALVTGSASGLGLAVARRLVSRGMRVIGLDRQDRESTESGVHSLTGDIRSEEDVNRCLGHCLDASGQPRLDLVVNCAGVANAFKVFNVESQRPQRLQDFRDLVEINICGAFNVIRLSVQLLSQSNNPLVITTSSSFSREGHEGQTGFCATQTAVEAMTLPLARDLAAKNIRVVTLAAGFFATPLVLRCDSPELLDFIKMTTACPSRLGEPEEFAQMVEQVVDNRMINGCTIRVDGANRWPERG